MNKIPVNLTISQLKKIVEEAEKNEELYYFADDTLTLHVENNYIKVTQPVAGVYDKKSNVELFSKTINKSYSV
ncbi:hypothetical protein ACI3ER_11845 [Bacillus sp. Wb]